MNEWYVMSQSDPSFPARTFHTVVYAEVGCICMMCIVLTWQALDVAIAYGGRRLDHSFGDLVAFNFSV